MSQDTETSALGQVLTKLLSGVEHIKSTSEMDKALVSELKRTVSDHDKAIVLMAKAVEDMNKNSAEMTSVFKEFQKSTAEFQREVQKEQLKHWQAQDKTMGKVETILEKMAGQEPRLAAIERTQINGCPSFAGFLKQRDGELRHWEDVKQTLLTAVQRNREEINALQAGLAVLVEQVKVENKRIADLEECETEVKDAVDTLKDSFNAYKETNYKAAIGYAVAIIGAMATALWALMTK